MKKLLYFTLLLFMGISCTSKRTLEESKEEEEEEDTFVYVDFDSVEINSTYLDSCIREMHIRDVMMYGDTAIAQYVWKYGRPANLEYNVMTREEAIEWLDKGKNKRK